MYRQSIRHHSSSEDSIQWIPPNMSQSSLQSPCKMAQDVKDLTLVLFGNSSAVKYGVRNKLLGREQNKTVDPDYPLFTLTLRDLSGHNVTVINILNLQDEELHLDSVDQVPAQIINKNDIHAFIFILQVGQFTDTDKLGLEWLQERFGEQVMKFLWILFTYEREEEHDTITDDLKKNLVLEQLISKCGGRYHICSKSMNVHSEIKTLLEKIGEMVSENSPPSYTAKMYDAAFKPQDSKMQQSESFLKKTSIKRTSAKSIQSDFNILIVGKRGAEKCETGNAILGREAFSPKRWMSKNVQIESGIVGAVKLDVYDIPGEIDSEVLKKCQQIFQNSGTVPTVILLVEMIKRKNKFKDCVTQLDRNMLQDKNTTKWIENLPPRLLQNTWLILTIEDDLGRENLTAEEIIEQTEELRTVLKKLQKRYHIFNNKIQKSDQMMQLIAKIKEAPLKLSPEIMSLPPTKPPTTKTNSLDKIIVLLGKTGTGKSATANTILGEERFTSDLCTASVTAESEMEQGFVAGRKVSIVDTPGLFDTSMSAEDLHVEIGKSVYLSSPGPHAFLYVLQINSRFTEQEEEVIHKFEMMFGEEMRKYTIVLFTHGDQLEGKNPETLIKKNSSLRGLVEQCGGGYHIFNNKDLSNREQVTQLLEKIDRMVEKNGGSCYCNQMFEDAARFRREEDERKMNEEQKRRERDKKQMQIEIHKVRKGRLEEFEHQRNVDLSREEEERKHRESKRLKEMERVWKETEVKCKKEMFEEFARLSQKKEEEKRWRKEEKIKHREEEQKVDECKNNRRGSIAQKWLEMEKLRGEEKIKQEVERKKKQLKDRQSEIDGMKKEVTDDSRQESDELPEQKQYAKDDKNTLKKSGKKDLGYGFQIFLEKHDRHLAAAGQIGAGVGIAFGVSAGMALAAGVGAGIGVAFGPVGIAIGAAVGGVIGGVGGAVCSAIKAKKL